MTVVFMGTPDFAVPSLEALYEGGFDIVGVITQPDRPKGRGQKLSPPPVKERAFSLGLPVYQPEKIKDPEVVKFLQDLKPDFIVVVAFGQILPKAILDIPKWGCINVHGSLLPQYRGAAPIHWAIINGERETGITTMFMDIGLDTGDMLMKAKVDISRDMTTGELYNQLAPLGGQVLVETLLRLKEGSIVPEPQNNNDATYAPLLNSEHEVISWEKSAQEVHNLVRGMNPWPGAYTFYKGSRLKIWGSQLQELKEQGIRPGQILAVDDEGFWVQTRDKPLLITRVQPAGKKVMAAKDFFNGYQVQLGSMLGDNHA